MNTPRWDSGLLCERLFFFSLQAPRPLAFCVPFAALSVPLFSDSSLLNPTRLLSKNSCVCSNEATLVLRFLFSSSSCVIASLASGDMLDDFSSGDFCQNKKKNAHAQGLGLGFFLSLSLPFSFGVFVDSLA